MKADFLLISLPIIIVQINNQKLATTLLGLILKKVPTHIYLHMSILHVMHVYIHVHMCFIYNTHVYMYIYIYIYKVMKLYKQVGLKLAKLLATIDKFVTFDVT